MSDLKATVKTYWIAYNGEAFHTGVTDPGLFTSTNLTFVTRETEEEFLLLLEQYKARLAATKSESDWKIVDDKVTLVGEPSKDIPVEEAK